MIAHRKSKDYPTVFLIVGLQGSGKTITFAKLALWLASEDKIEMTRDKEGFSHLIEMSGHFAWPEMC